MYLEDADMNGGEVSIVQALSFAGSALAIGIVVGWLLALFQLGGSSGGSIHRDKDN
jgi:hypothetical protein